MAKDKRPLPEWSLSLFWATMLVSFLLMLGVLYYLIGNQLSDVRNPEAGPWLLGTGLFSVLVAWRLTPGEDGRRQRKAREMDEMLRQQAMRRITLGVGLAEAPGILGVVYYMMTHEPAGFALLAAGSLILFLRVRPG